MIPAEVYNAMHRLRNRRQFKNIVRISSAFGPVAAISASVLWGGLYRATPAFADGLPAQTTPPGYHAADNDGGGRVLSGSLPNAATNGDAFRAGLHQLKAYFGESLQVTGAVQAKDKGVTTALFKAKLHGVPVIGLTVVSFAPHGGSWQDILFDTSNHFASSFASLQVHVKAMPGPNSPAKPTARSSESSWEKVSVTLVPHRAPDGTVGISIPDDWKVGALGQGMVSVSGPHKEMGIMGLNMAFLDPNSQRARNAVGAAQFTHGPVVTPQPLASYSEDVAQAFTNGYAAFCKWHHLPDPAVQIENVKSYGPGSSGIGGTLTDGPIRRKFFGIANCSQVGLGAWSMTVNLMSAPVEEFPHVGQLLLAIENSVKYNAAIDHMQKTAVAIEIAHMTQGAIERTNRDAEAFRAAQQERFDAAMAASAAAQDTIDKAAAGWIHILRDDTVLARRSTDTHETWDSTSADALIRDYPDQFAKVPPSEYRKGIDY